VTRAAEQSSELVRALSEQGAEVFSLPLVRFAALLDFAALDRELGRLTKFDAVLFLSANAVRYVLDRCAKLGIAIESACWPPLIAAVGPATERAIAASRLRVDYMARSHNGEALASELRGRLAGRCLLLPRSDRGDDAVPRALRETGALVTEVVAYRTALPERIDAALADKVRNGNVDAVIFASPSAVRNFTVVFGAQTLASLANKIGFAAIGPTTAKALRAANLPVTIEASDSSAEGLASAIMEFYRKQTVRQTQ
jgi:uroporphyrinogen-III synthase